MKTRFSSLALLLATLTVATSGCDINIDGPQGGNDDSDTDGEDEGEGAGGDSMLSARDTDDTAGSGPSLPSAGGK